VDPQTLVDMCPPGERVAQQLEVEGGLSGPDGARSVSDDHVVRRCVRCPSPMWTVTYEEARRAVMCGGQVLETQVTTWVWC